MGCGTWETGIYECVWGCSIAVVCECVCMCVRYGYY